MHDRGKRRRRVALRVNIGRDRATIPRSLGVTIGMSARVRLTLITLRAFSSIAKVVCISLDTMLLFHFYFTPLCDFLSPFFLYIFFSLFFISRLLLSSSFNYYITINLLGISFLNSLESCAYDVPPFRAPAPPLRPLSPSRSLSPALSHTPCYNLGIIF